MGMTPFPYQVDGINHLKNRDMAALWDDPGLGKSFQTLRAIIDKGIETVLIICPASVRLVWAQECAKVGLESQVVMKSSQIGPGINITSYEGASGKMFADFVQIDWELIVLDEQHFAKNPKAKRTKRIFGDRMDGNGGLLSCTERMWCLTGTPMPNNPSELYPMCRAMFPDSIMNSNGHPMTYWQFVGRYCVTRDNGFGVEITGGKNLNKLREQLRGRVLRRKKEDVLKDLPKIRYDMLHVEGDIRGLPKEELEIIKECLEKDDPLDALRKQGTHVASVRRVTGMAKVKAVKKWIEDNDHDKIVIFAHHRAVIDELCSLPDTVKIDGSCSQAQREDAVFAFQHGKAKRLVGQIRAAGTGLTLTAAQTLLFVEYSWVPAENRQAADRIHRIGQDHNCMVYFAAIPGSIDEDIMKAVKRKLKIYEELGL